MTTPDLRKIVDRYKLNYMADKIRTHMGGDSDSEIADIAALIDALVEERAERRKREWIVRHYDISGAAVFDMKLEKCCQNERHDWTNDDWRTQVKAELGAPDWREDNERK